MPTSTRQFHTLFLFFDVFFNVFSSGHVLGYFLPVTVLFCLIFCGCESKADRRVLLRAGETRAAEPCLAPGLPGRLHRFPHPPREATAHQGRPAAASEARVSPKPPPAGGLRQNPGRGWWWWGWQLTAPTVVVNGCQTAPRSGAAAAPRYLSPPAAGGRCPPGSTLATPGTETPGPAPPPASPSPPRPAPARRCHRPPPATWAPRLGRGRWQARGGHASGNTAGGEGGRGVCGRGKDVPAHAPRLRGRPGNRNQRGEGGKGLCLAVVLPPARNWSAVALVRGRKAAHRDGGRGGPRRAGALSCLEGDGLGWGWVLARRGTGAAPLTGRGAFSHEAVRGGGERPCRSPAAAAERGKERMGRLRGVRGAGLQAAASFLSLGTPPSRGPVGTSPAGDRRRWKGRGAWGCPLSARSVCSSAAQRCSKLGTCALPLWVWGAVWSVCKYEEL